MTPTPAGIRAAKIGRNFESADGGQSHGSIVIEGSATVRTHGQSQGAARRADPHMRGDGRTASGRRETTRECASFHAREEKTIDVLAAHSVTDLEGSSHWRKE